MAFYTDYPLYPTSIFTDENYPNQTDDIDTVYAALVNALKEELQAVMAELGTVPKGVYASVKARLNYYSNWQKYTQAAGRVSGGVVTDAGSGNINIASGAGYFKTSDSEIGVTVYLTWDAVSDFSLDDNAVNYIHINYNGGTPAIQKTTDRATIELNREFNIARVYRSGNSVHILNSGVNLPNFFRKEHERLLSVRGFEHATGGVISEPAGRYLKSTAGLFYFSLNTITTILQDTTGAHRFTSWYRASPSGWTKVADQAQVDNEYYDDGTGTRHLVASNRYGVFWIYVHYDSDIHVVYGRDSYKLSKAEAALMPDDLPDQVGSFAILAAKVIIKRDAASFTSIVSGYKKLFPTTSPSDHNDLAGLQGGQVDQYYHMTSAQHGALGAVPKKIQDADGDTSWDTEETSDKDEIQGKVAGVEFFRGHNDGIITLAKQSDTRVYLGTANQTIASGGAVKVELNAETRDIQNEFDPTVNYRFTAKKAGKYIVIGSVNFSGVPANKIYEIYIYINGAFYTRARQLPAIQQDVYVLLSDVVGLSVNDYVELHVYHNTGVDQEIRHGSDRTYFSISKLQ